MTSQTVATPSAGFARRTPEETSVQLETSLTSGLTTQEANSRRLRYGANEFEVEDDEPIYIKFFKSFYENPLILLLLASAVVSLLMEQYDDAISITLVSQFHVSLILTIFFFISSSVDFHLLIFLPFFSVHIVAQIKQAILIVVTGMPRHIHPLHHASLSLNSSKKDQDRNSGISWIARIRHIVWRIESYF